MAFLIDVANEGKTINVDLFKPITTLGSAQDNDVVITSGRLPTTAAHIHFDGTNYTLSSVDRKVDIHVKGKKIRKTQLEDGAVFALGGMELMFRKKPLAQTTRVVDEIKPEAVPAEAYKRLVAFSEKLAHAKNMTAF